MATDIKATSAIASQKVAPHSAPASSVSAATATPGQPSHLSFNDLINSSFLTESTKNNTQNTGLLNADHSTVVTQAGVQGSMQLGAVVQKPNSNTNKAGHTNAAGKTTESTGTSLASAVKGFTPSGQQQQDDLSDLWGSKKQTVQPQYASEMSPADLAKLKRQNSLLAKIFPGVFGDNDPFASAVSSQNDAQIAQWQQHEKTKPLVPLFIDELVAKEEQNKNKALINEALKNNCETRRDVFKTMACNKLYPRMKTLEPDWETMFYAQMIPPGEGGLLGPDDDYGKFTPLVARPELLAENNSEYYVESTV